MEEILNNMPDARAIAYVDMGDSVVLASHADGPDLEGKINSIAISGIEMFSGHHVIMLEDKLDGMKTVDRQLGNFFDLMIASGPGVVALFQRDREDTERFVMVLANSTANIGLLTVKIRNSVAKIRDLLGE